jgi:hypothetical protein
VYSRIRLPRPPRALLRGCRWRLFSGSLKLPTQLIVLSFEYGYDLLKQERLAPNDDGII